MYPFQFCLHRKPILKHKPEDPHPPAPEPPVEHKPLLRKIITEIILYNNRTGTGIHYYNEEGNKCGLGWLAKEGAVVIQQLYTFDKTSWKAKGLYTDYSLHTVKWETIEVPHNQRQIEQEECDKYEYPKKTK
jgi:hypothetical protein